MNPTLSSHDRATLIQYCDYVIAGGGVMLITGVINATVGLATAILLQRDRSQPREKHNDKLLTHAMGEVITGTFSVVAGAVAYSLTALVKENLEQL